MIIGSYGMFWERDLVDWDARPWQLLGRRGLNSGTLRMADFRRARGVYILYNDLNVYYVGLASSRNGIGGRLRDHLKDEHGSGWTRFSWFAFDSPDESDEPDVDGVIQVVDQYGSVELDTKVLIRDLEALLQAATQPSANKSVTKFRDGEEWLQVATLSLEVLTFDDLKPRLS